MNDRKDGFYGKVRGRRELDPLDSYFSVESTRKRSRREVKMVRIEVTGISGGGKTGG